ncbi:MAG: phage tail tube protein [Desulfosporosinus sp.]
MSGKRGVGTTITQGVTNIGILTNIVPPEGSADTVDTTTLDTADGYRTFIQGMRDGGEVTLQGYFDVTDAGQVAMKTALDAGTVDSYTITSPTTIGAALIFDAIVTKWKVGEANLDDVVGFEVTLKVSGKTTLGTTATTGASAASMVQTDGSTALTAYAITPTFVIGTLIYGVTYTTQTSFKPKITAASHTIKIYVDGVYVETVASGSAGSAIAIGAAETKEVKVVVYEAAKTPKTYTFMVSRLS